MKIALFNFLVLQVIVWSIVFSPGLEGDDPSVNYASISDTWRVVEVADDSSQDVVMHYPTFHKLTLNMDGSYIRLKNAGTIETGSWSINEEKSILVLKNNEEELKYDIVQAPGPKSETFVIVEKIHKSQPDLNIKYKLTRM